MIHTWLGRGVGTRHFLSSRWLMKGEPSGGSLMMERQRRNQTQICALEPGHIYPGGWKAWDLAGNSQHCISLKFLSFEGGGHSLDSSDCLLPLCIVHTYCLPAEAFNSWQPVPLVKEDLRLAQVTAGTSLSLMRLGDVLSRSLRKVHGGTLQLPHQTTPLKQETVRSPSPTLQRAAGVTSSEGWSGMMKMWSKTSQAVLGHGH